MNLAEEVYRLTERFPFGERFGLTAQMRRSAVSVPSNIAEACGRTSKRDFAYFLGVAGGSLQELETQIALAVRLGWIADGHPIHTMIGMASSQLITLRKQIERDLRRRSGWPPER